MSRILVFSDSHGITKTMFDVIKSVPGVGYIIHLGDICKDVIKLEQEFLDIKVFTVLGNNDPYYNFETEKLIYIDEIPIFITHGHNYNLNSDTLVLLRSEEAKKARIILYGHTHVPWYEVIDGKIFANPGSISKPRYLSGPSYGIIEIENDKIRYSNIEL